MRIGDTIEYFGRAIPRPASIEKINGVVADIVDDALVFHTGDKDIMFGILTDDCKKVAPKGVPASQLLKGTEDWSLSDNTRMRAGSWT